MVVAKLSYEECRRQRLEENKKRMEELNLTKLSQALKTPSPKHSSVKRRLPKSQKSEPVRRSSRFADKPAPNYKEERLGPLLTRRRSYQRRDLLNRIYASDEERGYAIERAERIQSGLDSQHPSFVKPMLQSHVTGGFWLGLPVYFCKNYLPLDDETITLVDEEGNEFPTKYIAERTGLSGGWRGFSIDHELVDGDALVFQLVKPTTFKVNIVRVYDSEDDEDNKENSDETHLHRIAKRTRAKDNKKNNEDSEDHEDNKENSDETHLSRNAKQSRTRNNKGNSSEDSDDTHKGRSARRTRASARRK